VPVAVLGEDCEKFCKHVKNHLGDPFDLIELLTYGAIRKGTVVCADLVTTDVPPEIAKEIHDWLKANFPPGSKEHRGQILISPDGFAKFFGAPPGKDVSEEGRVVIPSGTAPAPRPHAHTAKCHITVTLISVKYLKGESDTDEWNYQVIVNDARRALPPKSQRNGEERFSGEEIYSADCGSKVTVRYYCDGTDVDVLGDDFNSTEATREYACPTEIFEKITLDVPTSDNARIVFTYHVVVQ
jgi:hypothetical protein